MLSSGSKINYDLRPAKSVERKMICDLLHLLQARTSFFLPKQYIGMGSKYFSDFLLLHNEFAFEEMISIEGDEEAIERYEFNKPLKCIDIRPGMTSSVLPTLNWGREHPSVVWLDYDGCFEKYMVDDIGILARKLIKGSVFFVSLNSSIPENALKKEESTIVEDENKTIVTKIKRIDWLRSKIENYYLDSIKETDLSNKNRTVTFKKIFDQVIAEELRRRNMLNNDNLVYRQLTFIKYQDGAEMMTFGGMFLEESMLQEIEEAQLSTSREFIIGDMSANPWSIEVPKLTYKEVQTILKIMPFTEDVTDVLMGIGITDKDIQSFSKIYRYYPHFVQAALTS
jgi:hypothetical protein